MDSAFLWLPAYQVINAQLLQLQHHIAEVASQDLRVGLLLQIRLEGGFRVQPETFPWPGSPSTTTALVGRSLKQHSPHPTSAGTMSGQQACATV
jgi:hypothetical protein